MKEPKTSVNSIADVDFAVLDKVTFSDMSEVYEEVDSEKQWKGLKFKMTLMTEGVHNELQFRKDEMQNSTETWNENIKMRIDHSRSVRDIVGFIKNVGYLDNIETAEGLKAGWQGWGLCVDKDIAPMIKDGRIDSGSTGLRLRFNKGENGQPDFATDIVAREWSLVTDPADANAKIVAVANGVKEKLYGNTKGDMKMGEDKKETPSAIAGKDQTVTHKVEFDVKNSEEVIKKLAANEKTITELNEKVISLEKEKADLSEKYKDYDELKTFKEESEKKILSDKVEEILKLEKEAGKLEDSKLEERKKELMEKAEKYGADYLEEVVANLKELVAAKNSDKPVRKTAVNADKKDEKIAENRKKAVYENLGLDYDKYHKKE